MSLNVTTYSEYIKKAVEILPRGAFLTVKGKDKVNPMTIGWGAFGFQWGMPTVEVMVRESRFTKAILDDSMEFTLSFPLDESMKTALSYCGSKSGRDTDKVKDLALELLDSENIETPSVLCKGIIMECKVVSSITMSNDSTDKEILEKWYKNGDLHTMYYAKILNCRELD